MKILMINTVNLEANGISTFILSSSKQLSQMGNSVYILAPNKVDSRIKAILKKNKIELKEILNRNKHPLIYFEKLKSFLASRNFDVVHVNGNSTTVSLELLAAKLAKVPLRVAHSHSVKTEHLQINRLLRPMFEYSVNRRLACSQLAGKWLFKNKSFKVLPNGIDLKKYKFNKQVRKKLRSRFDFLENDVVLGHVGKFNYQKNQEFLIRLLSHLPTRYKLILIGDGDNQRKIKKLVTKLKLTDRVIFTGKIDNVADYLNAMDVFLLPSLFEGQPFVVVEALASGLPIILSDKIHEELDIPNSMTFISLNEKKWGKALIDINTRSRDKRAGKNIQYLIDKKYDIKEDGKILMKFYLS